MNKNKLDKEDPQVRAVAIAIVTSEAHMLPESVVKYGKDLLEMETVSYKELSQHFQHQGFSTEIIKAGVDMLVENGIVDKYEFGSIDRIRFTPEMIELIKEVTPNETKENDMEKGNKQDASNQGSIQKADTVQGNRPDPNKATRSKFDEQVEKISNKQNQELAQNLIGGEVSSLDEEVNLVRAIYDENAQGVNFDTIANKFDVRGERSSLFIALSKDLQQRGVIDKIPGANGDLYVVTMPFRQLMENAKRGDTQRYETGGSDVSQARTQGTQELAASGDQQQRADQDRRDENNGNDRRTGQTAEQYKNETGRDLSQDLVEKRDDKQDANRGTATAMQRTDTTAPGNQPSDSQARSIVDTPMSMRDQQRDTGNDGRASQGETGSSGDDTGQGNKGAIGDLGDDFKPDPSVLSISIAIFGTSMSMDDVASIKSASRTLLDFAEKNPNVKPTFEKNGVVFNVERAKQFIQNARFYGIVE